MARGAALLVALVLALGSGGRAAAEPHGDGTDHALQREIERLHALRTSDPSAFVAQARTLEGLPPPTNITQRESLAFLHANRFVFEGRHDAAIALAKPLAESASDPSLRLRAASFMVNLRALTRDFEGGLRDLNQLLKAHPDAAGAMRADVLNLWNVASIFYAELGKADLSGRYAQRLLEHQPSPRLACFGNHFLLLARVAAAARDVAAGDFERVDALCRDTGEVVVPIATALAHARFLRDRQRHDEALRLLEDRLGAIDRTGYRHLTAEAYALHAELLFAAGRFEAAGHQARHALTLAKDMPTSLPVLMAEQVLFDLANRRGDSAAALRHLQNHAAANRALAEEGRIKELAFLTVQHEELLREQALAVLAERHRELELEAQVARAEARNTALAVGLLALGLLALGAWGWRLLGRERRSRAAAQTDALTGFANRRHFTASAEAVLARAERAATPVMLLAFDLDHFKRINDEHGHLTGDAVLRAVSEAVRQVPVEPGVQRLVGRIGGEEFALLLEGATPEAALRHAEACRTAIADARAPTDAEATLSVTASFGVTGTPESGYRLNALLAAADRALYRAKSAGRDQVGSSAAREAA